MARKINNKDVVAEKPISRQKLSDQVFDRLWEMISHGELSPGDDMPSERALMERFGVGRPAVREALQSLANKGVISINHGERSKVNQIDASIAIGQVDNVAKLLLSAEPSNIEHLKQVRKILEQGTARIAAQKATARDIAELRALVEKQRLCLEDSKAFIGVDIEFHARIAQITGNPLLQVVTKSMLSWLFEYYRPILHWSGREKTTLSEHSHIVDLLENKDQDGAAVLMFDHLSRSDPIYTTG